MGSGLLRLPNLRKAGALVPGLEYSAGDAMIKLPKFGFARPQKVGALVESLRVTD
jgi:hypothetical protein